VNRCADSDSKCDVENWIVTTLKLDDALCWELRLYYIRCCCPSNLGLGLERCSCVHRCARGIKSYLLTYLLVPCYRSRHLFSSAGVRANRLLVGVRRRLVEYLRHGRRAEISYADAGAQANEDVTDWLRTTRAENSGGQNRRIFDR